MSKTRKSRKEMEEMTKTLEELTHTMILQEFQEFITLFKTEKFQSRVDHVCDMRTLYCPGDDEEFFSNQNFDYAIWDSTPINSIYRTVAGFMSYHYSPSEEFFRIQEMRNPPLTPEGLPDAERLKQLTTRKEELHRLVQHRDNVIVYAKNYRDKVIFGYTAKVIEEDPFLKVRFSHYAPEDFAVTTSNGKILDIFGVREKLTHFQAKQRFGRVDIENVRTGLFDYNYEDYYRFNIPRSVLWAHLNETIDFDVDKMAYDMARKLLKVDKGYTGQNDYEWVDFWVSDRQLLNVKVQPYRNIIVSQFMPSNKGVGLGKGLGEINKSTHLILTETELINLAGYEKTIDPPWGVHTESETYGINLQRGEYTTFDQTGTEPKPLTVKADIRSMIEYKNYVQARFDRNCYLDSFELINKSRMTKEEVATRTSEDFRRLGIYVVQDQADDLNPTLTVVNAISRDIFEEPEFLVDVSVNAFFTSPLSLAHKNSEMERAMRIAELTAITMQNAAVDSPVNDLLDYKNKLSKFLANHGDEDWLGDREDVQRKSEERKAKEKLLLEQAQADALTSSSQAIRAASPEEGGAGGAGGGGGAQAQPPRQNTAPPPNLPAGP